MVNGANSPISKIRGLGGIECILYKNNGDGKIPIKNNGEINGECDHIKPRAIGGTNNEWNLQYLCQFCHAEKTIIDNNETKAIKNYINKFKKIEQKLNKHKSNDTEFHDLLDDNSKTKQLNDSLQQKINDLQDDNNKMKQSNDLLQQNFSDLQKKHDTLKQKFINTFFNDL